MSYLWTTGTSGDGTNTYTQADASNFMKVIASCMGFEGVAPNYLNALVVTGAATPLSMNTGGAMVDGKPYYNSAALSITIPTPASATRIDRLVLRASWSAYTVRLTRIAGTEGGGVPAITQSSGTTYDIKLYQVSVTTGGVITLTDERTLTSPLISRQGGDAASWQLGGANNYVPVGWKVQSGAMAWAGGASSGTIPVTFPVTFSNTPLIFMQLHSAYVNIILSVNGVGAPSYNCSWQTIDGSTVYGFTFNWLAIGPA